MIVDAHCHLVDDYLKPFLPLIIRSCEANGIVIFSNSMNLESSRISIELGRKHSELVKVFVGVHPWEANNFQEDAFDRLVVSELNSISGIGEIGLDWKYLDRVPMKAQRRVLEHQLQLAEKYLLPVNVHSRRAYQEVLDTLGRYSLKSVLLHWFSGTEDQMERGLDRGYFFSFGPTVLYSKKTQKLLIKCGLDRVLVETDSPVEYNACFGNTPSNPLFIYSVAYAISNILKKNLEETLNIMLNNSQNYIGRKMRWR
ncbi:MAG: TatD family hydrolase [Nitrososphaeria archaeon]